MNSKKILDELSQKIASASNKKALVGLDGFVDKIIKMVDSRHGQGSAFEPIPTIEAFGQRILDAAGKSANIEMYEDYEKIGGNGPIMANALLAEELSVQYVGALGLPINPVFEEFAAKTNAVSVAPPGITHALEFEDGKLMLGAMSGLDQLTYPHIIEHMGEGAFLDAVNSADLIAMLNWTMIPNMTAIYEDLLIHVLPHLGPKESGRFFYFDLTDPAKRTRGDLKEVLSVISRFRSFGSVTLGLNLSEAQQICEILDLGEADESSKSLEAAAARIRNTLNLSCVVVHPRSGAAVEGNAPSKRAGTVSGQGSAVLVRRALFHGHLGDDDQSDRLRAHQRPAADDPNQQQGPAEGNVLDP